MAERLPTTQAPVQVCFTNDAITEIELVTPSNPLPVSAGSSTSGGATPYHLAGGSTASTNATNVKNSAGTLYGIVAINTTATIGYLRLYDTAAAPNPASATGAGWSIPIPANSSGAGVSIPLPPAGMAFANGISFAFTGGGADTDNTNGPAAVFINLLYK